MGRIGRLDRRIQFRRSTESDDGYQMVEQFADYGAPVWASKTDVSDGERLRAGEVSASLTSRFVVRSTTFTRGITPKDAIQYDGRTFEIFGIKERGRNRELEITAGAEVNE